MSGYIKREDVLRLVRERAGHAFFAADRAAMSRPDLKDKLRGIGAALHDAADAIEELPVVEQEPVSEERERCAKELEATVSSGWLGTMDLAMLSRAARLLRAPQQQTEPVAWRYLAWEADAATGLAERYDYFEKGRPGANAELLYAVPPPDDEAVALLRDIERCTDSQPLRRRISAYLARKEPKG